MTKPYSDEQWARIESLGRRIDLDLRVGDVRLTMGGEPTFVSIDDMDGAEWNVDADGPAKRERAGYWSGASWIDSRPAVCCTTARGSGIRENH